MVKFLCHLGDVIGCTIFSHNHLHMAHSKSFALRFRISVRRADEISNVSTVDLELSQDRIFFFGPRLIKHNPILSLGEEVSPDVAAGGGVWILVLNDHVDSVLEGLVEITGTVGREEQDAFVIFN